MKQFQQPLFRDFAPRIQVRAVSDDTPNGGGSGCGNVTGYLDSWGTMVLPGAFEECIPFLNESGFLCDGHGHSTNGYTEESNLGFFNAVSEDEEGLQLGWLYHSKQCAQDARTTLAERLANGKTSGLSIGFFVGDGRTSPKGWTYDPDEDMPEGTDYICVYAQHFEEVLIEVSKPEFLKDNLARAANCTSIYLFLRVHVFEVSQTLVPANEVSLIAEVRNSNSHKSKTTMATTRAKREDDDDDSKRDDAIQGIKRTHRAMKNEHREYTRAMSEHLDNLEKYHDKLTKGKGDEEDDDDDDKEPDEEEPEKKKSRTGRSLFNEGRKK